MYIETRFMPRFCDTDAAGHINNTAVTEWLESGRMDFYLNHSSCQFSGLMLRRLELNYDFEMEYLSETTIRTGVEKVGNTSVTLRQEVWQQGECRASARVVEVHIDPRKRKAAAISEDMRENYMHFHWPTE